MTDKDLHWLFGSQDLPDRPSQLQVGFMAHRDLVRLSVINLLSAQLISLVGYTVFLPNQGLYVGLHSAHTNMSEPFQGSSSSPQPDLEHQATIPMINSLSWSSNGR